MIKFKSSSCQLTYDPTGIAASRDANTVSAPSNPQQSYGSSQDNTGYESSQISQSYEEVQGRIEKRNKNLKAKISI